MVLPFETPNHDPSQDFLGDSIVDSLSAALAMQLPEAVVIAGKSRASYMTEFRSPQKANERLNARYLLAGSMFRSDGVTRINARLVDNKDGRELWADTFDGTVPDPLQLQDEITSRISSSLKIELPEIYVRQVQTPDDRDPLENMLRGRIALNDERRQAINPRKRAEEYLRKALATQSENTEILSLLSLVIAENLVNNRRLPPEARPPPAKLTASRLEAIGLLDRATGLLPANSDARLARALLSLYDRDLENARLQLEQARSLNPHDYVILYYLCLVYEYLGRPADGLPLFDEIYLKTGGKVPAYHLILLDWGRALILLSRWDDAIAKLSASFAIYPGPAENGALAIAYAGRGDMNTARSHFATWRDWYQVHFGAPNIRKLFASFQEVSCEPIYLHLVDASWLRSYRKLGLTDD